MYNVLETTFLMVYGYMYYFLMHIAQAHIGKIHALRLPEVLVDRKTSKSADIDSSPVMIPH